MKSNRNIELYHALLQKNFEDSLCKEIAYKYLTTEYTVTRMLGYLYRVSNPSVEMVVDEMLAILEDCNRFRKKKEMESAQAAINAIYNNTDDLQD